MACQSGASRVSQGIVYADDRGSTIFRSKNGWRCDGETLNLSQYLKIRGHGRRQRRQVGHEGNGAIKKSLEGLARDEPE